MPGIDRRAGWSRASLWPSGHGSWFYADPAQFEAGATLFLAAGLKRGERLVFVSDDPTPERWPSALIGQGCLLLASVDEAYGLLRSGDLDGQRELLAGFVADALGEGYRGIRVVADNTSLVSSTLDAERWMAWEALADELLASLPADTLCAFHRERVGVGACEELNALHRFSLTT